MSSLIETIIRGTITKGIQVVAEINRKRMVVHGKHPFLHGIHKPMAEELTLNDLPVVGTIPAALNGRYLRIGPNPVVPDPAGYHWFTGDGMVHGLAIKDGKAIWYRNRWIRSHKVATALGKTAAPGPRHGGFDTVNTNVVDIAHRTFALVEAGSYPVELSETLDRQTYNPFDGTLKGSFTAHPHLDPLTGEHHAIAYEATDPETIRHIVISPHGKVVREEPIKVAHGPSIHDCAITQRYVVILDLPVTISMKALIAGYSFPYRWNLDHRARIGVLPRTGKASDMVWINIDPCYIFHVANAFDLSDGRLVMDAVVHNSMFAESLAGPDGAPRGLERWTIDPVAKTLERRTIDATPQEFPRVDGRRFAQQHRYVYSVGLQSNNPAAHSETFILKYELETGGRDMHDFGEGHYPGEFVFVPANANSAEDEGWLVGFVVDLPRETTDFVILDAQSFSGEPVARIRLPHRIPPGFHGNWVANT